jgi:hypothetical protein
MALKVACERRALAQQRHFGDVVVEPEVAAQDQRAGGELGRLRVRPADFAAVGVVNQEKRQEQGNDEAAMRD